MQRLRDLVAKLDNSYAGVDLANAARLGSAIWLLGAALSFVLLPLAPPTDRLGDAGWFAAIALALIAGGGGYVLFRLGAAATPRQLLWNSYRGLFVIAAMVWLTGGVDSPWVHLFLLNLMFTAAVHPPRMAVPFFVAFIPVVLAPLVYDNASEREALSLATELGVWLVFGGSCMFLMATIRAQRLGLRREGERARHQARVDQLTGLQNRRAFDESLSRELQRARAASDSLSVLVADVDHFKEINDRFGHLEGDRLLKTVAEAIQHAIRGPDVAYRWGGDEFALILPGTDAAGAAQVAARIKAAVALGRTPDDQPLTLAVGSSELGPGTYSAAALLGEADSALLRAKSAETAVTPGSPG